MKLLTLVFLPFFFFSFAKQIKSQTYENLVFEGAGIRGLAYAGVVDELDRRHYREHIQRVGGTSAGAITAVLFALGYTGKEMELICNHTNFRKFNDGKWFFIGGINRMNNRYGWYRGEAFSKYIGKLIAAKTGDADITLQEMKDAGFPEVYLTGTCINKQELTIFSYQTFPDMKVRDAVRISMSIPMYFEAVFIDSTGKVMHHPKHPELYDVYIDGGITGNFPIWMFDTLDLSTGKQLPNPKTLGVRIDSATQIANDASDHKLVTQEITSFPSYVSALYVFINENLNRPPLSTALWDQTISVSSGGIGPKIRKLSLEEKQRLFQNGQLATRAFFELE